MRQLRELARRLEATRRLAARGKFSEAAEQLARELGKSRSQLYAEALREYLEKRRDEDITRRLNEIYDAEPELAELDPVLDALQLEVLRREKW